MSDCIFCRIGAKEIPAKLAHEGERVFAVWDIAPKAPTHILIIPREHIATLNDLRDEHRALAGELVLTAAAIAGRMGIGERGYRLVWNCGAEAGQTVWHIHLHLLGGRGMKWPPG